MYTQTLANKISEDYQWLIDHRFLTPHGTLSIDIVRPEKLKDGTYQVYVMHNAFGECSIPEFFGFQNPKLELTKYLKITNIPFKPEKYT